MPRALRAARNGFDRHHRRLPCRCGRPAQKAPPVPNRFRTTSGAPRGPIGAGTRRVRRLLETAAQNCQVTRALNERPRPATGKPQAGEVPIIEATL